MNNLLNKKLQSIFFFSIKFSTKATMDIPKKTVKKVQLFVSKIDVKLIVRMAINDKVAVNRQQNC